MQPVEADARHYDTTTRFFHWATFILLVEQWVGAQIIDDFPSGPLRVDARSLHITLGVVLAALLIGRIAWRLTRGRRLPLADNGALNLFAKGTHWALYGLLAAMVSVGVALTWARGDSIFNLFKLPSFAPGNRALVHQIQDLHAMLAWWIIGVAGIHAAAALVHRYLWRDGVLARMLPERRHG